MVVEEEGAAAESRRVTCHEQAEARAFDARLFDSDLQIFMEGC